MMSALNIARLKKRVSTIWEGFLSGSPGTGKSSIVAKFCAHPCGQDQILRNMRSIGIDLAHWLKKGLLQILCSRPTLQGLELHLLMMHGSVSAFNPSIVIIEPIINPTMDHSECEVKPILMRLIDFLKQKQITTPFTSLTSMDKAPETSQVVISSLIDTWVLLRNVEFNGNHTI